MLYQLLSVGLGSMLGGVSRYLVSISCKSIPFFSIPLGTFLVNILGCFLVGILYGLFEKNYIPGKNLQLFLTTGFCGGFTTFSTFVHENYEMFNTQMFVHSAFYAAASFFIGLILAYIGHYLVKLT